MLPGNFVVALVIDLEKVAIVVADQVSAHAEENAAGVAAVQVDVDRKRQVAKAVALLAASVKVGKGSRLRDVIAIAGKEALVALVPIGILRGRIVGIIEHILISQRARSRSGYRSCRRGGLRSYRGSGTCTRRGRSLRAGGRGGLDSNLRGLRQVRRGRTLTNRTLPWRHARRGCQRPRMICQHIANRYGDDQQGQHCQGDEKRHAPGRGAPGYIWSTRLSSPGRPRQHQRRRSQSRLAQLCRRRQYKVLGRGGQRGRMHHR